MKKRIAVSFLALLIIILTIVIGLSVITEDGWNFYHDDKVGYSFRYPPNARIDIGQSPIHPYRAVTIAFVIPKAQGYHGLVIDIQANPTNLEPLGFAKKIYRNTVQDDVVPDDLFNDPEYFPIANFQALKISLPPTQTDFMLFLPYKDVMFIIYPTGSAYNPKDPASLESRDLFYKILTTLEFDV